jgi:hypothetical protein
VAPSSGVECRSVNFPLRAPTGTLTEFPTGELACREGSIAGACPKAAIHAEDPSENARAKTQNLAQGFAQHSAQVFVVPVIQIPAHAQNLGESSNPKFAGPLEWQTQPGRPDMANSRFENASGFPESKPASDSKPNPVN